MASSREELGEQAIDVVAEHATKSRRVTRPAVRASMTPVHRDLRATAEEPGLRTPLTPGTRILRGDGFHLVARHERATVEGIRLARGGVAAGVERARALARAHGVVEVVWWAGELSRPAGLREGLLAAGLVPYEEEPLLVTLTTDRPPPAVAGVEVRRVEDLAGYREALEVDWEAWDVPDDVRERGRGSAAAAWAAQRESGVVEHHVAVVDGRVAGFGRLVATDAAGMLMGGAVLPWARGRGAYRALVHARWEASAARGTPRLLTAAGAMSTPVLERIGFARIGEVRLLRDPLLDAKKVF